MRNQRRLRAAAVLTALALAGIGACGRSETSTPAPGGSAGDSGPVDASKNTGPGFDGTTIKIGTLTDQSGPAKGAGDPITAGNDMYWKKVNAAGGVAGKYKVEVVKADTKYNPTEAITLYGQMKGNVAMFGQILGTGIVNALKEQLTGDEILAQPSTLDAYWVHEPALMPFGAPYQVQAVNGLDYAVRKLDAKNKNVCALTKSDDYGMAGLAGYDYAIPKLGLKSATKATFKQGDTDFTAQINALQGANCQIILYAGLPTDTAPIITAAATRQFSAKWLGLSASWNVALGASQLAPYFEANYLLVAEGGNWGDTSTEGMKQMMDDLAKYAPEQTPNGYFTFGYNEAWAVHQVLEFAAKQGDLTQKGIYDASHKIPKLTFGGNYGDYGYGEPAQREPSRQSSVFKIDKTKPNATVADEVNFTSAPAKEYSFK